MNIQRTNNTTTPTLYLRLCPDNNAYGAIPFVKGDTAKFFPNFLPEFIRLNRVCKSWQITINSFIEQSPILKAIKEYCIEIKNIQNENYRFNNLKIVCFSSIRGRLRYDAAQRIILVVPSSIPDDMHTHSVHNLTMKKLNSLLNDVRDRISTTLPTEKTDPNILKTLYLTFEETNPTNNQTPPPAKTFNLAKCCYHLPLVILSIFVAASLLALSYIYIMEWMYTAYPTTDPAFERRLKHAQNVFENFMRNNH